MTRSEKAFLMLAGLFVALIVLANIIAVKIIAVGSLFVPAAVLSYAITFTITDTVSEIWGKEKTQFLVTIGLVASIVSMLMIRLAIYWPAAPFWTDQQPFAALFGQNMRIVVASLAAYLVSQYHDVWAFHFWKMKTKGKHLWLRNNLSTFVSQFLDTVIFISLAFYGIVPIIPMIFAQYIVKIIIAALDTPIVYLVVKYVRWYSGENNDLEVKNTKLC